MGIPLNLRCVPESIRFQYCANMKQFSHYALPWAESLGKTAFDMQSRSMIIAKLFNLEGQNDCKCFLAR